MVCAHFTNEANNQAKEGIIPAWEDEANKNGGKWSIQLPKDKNRLNVDKMWLYTASNQVSYSMGQETQAQRNI